METPPRAPTDPFRALVVRDAGDGTFRAALESRALDSLPPGEVTIEVAYSSLNYKDMLSATGHRGITRSYPHTPGIDAAGVVVASSVDDVQVGDAVAVIGYDLGMNTSGGFGERIRVPASWVLTLPDGWTPRDAMRHGTAGLTAGLCVDALRESGLTKDAGEVVVTGASGGVGSIATAMLAERGYRVVAVSRREEARAFLRELGAVDVVPPEAIATSGGRPMAKERWAGAVDTLGGELLFELVKSMRYGGAVAACGMAQGIQFSGNVYPFILRGVRLLGVDSVELPRARKQRALERLAGENCVAAIDRIATEISLDELPAAITALGASGILGRRLVRVAG